MAYVGVSPVGTFGTGQKDRFSGNNSTTAFTMSRSVGAVSYTHLTLPTTAFV